MTVSANVVPSGVPAVLDDMYVVANPCTTATAINPGDYVSWSGSGIVPSSDDLAYWKVSGIGIAMDRNPAYDWAGRAVVNSALLIATRGLFRVSAAFSGQPDYGQLAYPDTTGSAVAAASGVTGLASTWNTASPVTVSGATAVVPVKGVAQVINWYNSGPAGTGQMDIRLWPRNADYY